MDWVMLLGVVLLVLILSGMLLGKLAWERGILLLLVVAVVLAAIYFLLGRT